MRRTGGVMISQSEVRRTLISYLKRSISLAEFENWIVSKSWNMHVDSDQATIDLVDDIDLALSEYSNSDLTIQELNQKLWEAAKQAVMIVNLASPALRAEDHATTSSSSHRLFALPVRALT